MVLRSYYSADTSGGVVYGDAGVDASLVNDGCGSRLALKSEELAEYVGRQFLKFYAQMIFAETIK